MKLSYTLRGLLIGMGIVLIQPQVIVALDPIQIGDIAKGITVLIDGQNPE